MSRRRPKTNLVDVIVGFLLAAAGVLLLLASVLQAVPSLYAIGALALLGGLIRVMDAFFVRVRDGIWCELVASMTLTVLGGMILRYSALGVGILTLLAGFAFLVNGLARLVCARNLPSLRGALGFVGLISLFLGGLVLSDVVPATAVQFGVLIGAMLVLDGLTALTIGRAERPALRAG